MKLAQLLMSCLFVLVATLPLVSSAAPQYSAKPMQLRSIRADFIQEKHLKILSQPIISTGSFTFQRPDSLRWEYKSPIRSILLMYDGKVKKFVERDGQLVEDQASQFGSMQVVLGEIGKWLDGRFTDNIMFHVDQRQKDLVVLTPKKAELAGMIERIELTLADKQGNLSGITIFEGPDSYTRMTFSNRVINEEFPVTVFTSK